MSNLSTSYLLPYPSGQQGSGYMGYYPIQTAYAPSYGTTGYNAVSGKSQQSTAIRRATTPRKAISPKYKPKKIKGSNVVPQAGWVLVKRQPHNMVSDCVARVVFHRTLGSEEQKA